MQLVKCGIFLLENFMKNKLSKEKYIVIAFDTTTMAYYMEKLKRDNNLDGRLIPLPKEIDAGCGAAFASKNLNIMYWENFMKTNNVVYRLIKEMEI